MTKRNFLFTAPCTDTTRLCRDDDYNCKATDGERLPFRCTRSVGHTGPHVACGLDSHNYRVWEETEIEDAVETEAPTPQ